MSALRLRVPEALEAVELALCSGPRVPREGLVFASDTGEPVSFGVLEDELAECFLLTKHAAEARRPVVYVLSQPDLLGQRGALAAMRAGALLSAVRSLALEGARDGLRANAVAIGEDADPARVASWVRTLLTEAGVSGELVRVDAAHLGKALP
jgi:NAD(P)-dependent dehydrogenase (short-subunit alcohol dehydrogenase family)